MAEADNAAQELLRDAFTWLIEHVDEAGQVVQEDYPRAVEVVDCQGLMRCYQL